METELDVVEGMQFDRGYLSPYFVTNAEKMIVELENPVHPHPREEAGEPADAAALLELVAQSGRPLLIIAEESRGRGAGHPGGQQAARRAQGRRRQGAGLRRSPQGDARGHRDPDRRPARSARISASSSRTSRSTCWAPPSGCASTRTTPPSSTAPARRRTSRAGSRSSRRRSRSRPPTMTARSCRSAWPSSPAVSPSSRSAAPPRSRSRRRKDRVEDAMHATKAAVEEGVVAGGGAALLYATPRARGQARRQPRPAGRHRDRAPRAAGAGPPDRRECRLRRRRGRRHACSTRRTSISASTPRRREYVNMIKAGRHRPDQGRPHGAAGRGVGGRAAGHDGGDGGRSAHQGCAAGDAQAAAWAWRAGHGLAGRGGVMTLRPEYSSVTPSTMRSSSPPLARRRSACRSRC